MGNFAGVVESETVSVRKAPVVSVRRLFMVLGLVMMMGFRGGV